MPSYVWARVRPPKDQTNFEGWTTSRFGWRLYRIFFKTYTEKVWGVPATEIQADWAAQRIKNLSLCKAVINALLPKRNQKEITSLIEEFQYPKYGPGMMWERCREQVEAQGTKVVMETPVDGRPPRGRQGGGGVRRPTAADQPRRTHVISSMPISTLLKAMDPPPPAEVLAAAKGLGYRDFLTIALVVPEAAGFPDNWIYVHSPDVHLGRIQNFGSWSPYLVKEGRTCLGLEYFVFEGDDLWTMRRRRPGRAGQAGAGRRSACSTTRRRSRPATWCGCRRRTRCTTRPTRPTSTPCGTGSAENTPNVYPGRPQRDAQVQQPGPLDVHGHALGGEHPRRRPHDIWTVNVEEEYHEEKEKPPAGGPDRPPEGSDVDSVPQRYEIASENGPVVAAAFLPQDHAQTGQADDRPGDAAGDRACATGGSPPPRTGSSSTRRPARSARRMSSVSNRSVPNSTACTRATSVVAPQDLHPVGVGHLEPEADAQDRGEDPGHQRRGPGPGVDRPPGPACAPTTTAGPSGPSMTARARSRKPRS